MNGTDFFRCTIFSHSLGQLICTYLHMYLLKLVMIRSEPRCLMARSKRYRRSLKARTLTGKVETFLNYLQSGISDPRRSFLIVNHELRQQTQNYEMSSLFLLVPSPLSAQYLRDPTLWVIRSVYRHVNRTMIKCNHIRVLQHEMLSCPGMMILITAMNTLQRPIATLIGPTYRDLRIPTRIVSIMMIFSIHPSAAPSIQSGSRASQGRVQQVAREIYFNFRAKSIKCLVRTLLLNWTIDHRNRLLPTACLS